MLELLFKYPADLFARGVVELSIPWAVFALVVAGLAAAVAAAGYARLGRDHPPARRFALGAARTALLALAALALLRPELVVPVAEPVQGDVAVLIDDSRSMRIADHGEAPRARFAVDAFAPGTGAVSRRLEDRFAVHHYRFAVEAAPLRDVSELAFDGARSALGRALGTVRADLGDRPLAAVVLVSDGGHEGVDALEDALTALRAAGVPVHAVGVGRQRHARDLELSAVRLPGVILAGDTVESRVTVGHRGLGGEPVRVTVEDGGIIVHQREIRLPEKRDRVTVTLPLELAEAGAHRLVFRVEPVAGETVAENNEEVALVRVRGERFDVLHLEGEPRFEVKFTRRALADDDGVRLVSLVRTAENKLYRLGVDDPGELADGFPEKAETLFAYHAVILGSVEAAHLSDAQQRLLMDFVARRGGGLLFLGGRLAFAEGGYGGSLLAGLLPVSLGERTAGFRAAVRVRPTPAGREHPVARIGGEAIWSRLPRLTAVNPVRRVKPGATLLLGGDVEGAEPVVALAFHRYGRGTVAVLPVRDTWRWQMHGDVPPDDPTHETFWRQLVRWLVRPATGRVRARLASPAGVPGEPVRVEAEALDREYHPLDGADVRLVVVDPLGGRAERALAWSAAGAGRYEARFTPRDAGRHDLRVSLREAGREVAGADLYLGVSAAGREFHGAELDAGRLRRLAEATGGRYYPASAAGSLPDAIPEAARGRTTVRRLPLWDVPALYLLLLLLAGAEWAYRRRVKLP